MRDLKDAVQRKCISLILSLHNVLGDIGKVHFIDGEFFPSEPPQERGIWVSYGLPEDKPANIGGVGLTITVCGRGGAASANGSLQLIFCHYEFALYCRWAYFGSVWYGWQKIL